MALKRIAILASGRGSNFCAIADAIRVGKIRNAEVVGLICHKKNAPALEAARARGIPAFLIESDKFKKGSAFDRDSYENELLHTLEKLSPDLICLAGYMLLLGKRIVSKYERRILNIHPSLLPKYKGLHAQRQALQAKETVTGCTVHFVTPDLDSGDTICQKTVPILPGDTEEALAARLLPIEHEAYVEAVKLLCG